MFFELSVGFLIASFVTERYLAWRQRACYFRNDVPKRLGHLFSQDQLKKSNLYSLDASQFSLLRSCFRLVIDIVSWFYLARMWSFASKFFPESEIFSSLVFALLAFGIDTLINLPWELYGTFVLEERHGFNRQTLRLFVLDKIKMIGLTLTLGGPVLGAVIWIVKYFGRSFVNYL